MRTLIGTICILLVGIGFAACAQKIDSKPLVKSIGKELLQPDSVIASTLGRMATNVLFSPDKVCVYKLEPKKDISKDDYESEPHFVRSVYIGNLDKQMIALVNYILLNNPQSYTNDSTVAQTFYLPVIELEYKKKKDVVNVIISPNDGTWTVISDGKRQFNHNFKNRELVIRLIDSLLAIKAPEKK